MLAECTEIGGAWMIIRVKYFYPDKRCEIAEIEVGNWIDLRAGKSIMYEAGDFFKMPLGVAMELPVGFEAYVLPRSSTFPKYGVIQTNSMGIIDNSYCGDNDEWLMPLYALKAGEIMAGDRIAQFRVMPIMTPVILREVFELTNKDRGGFGSTGVR